MYILVFSSHYNPLYWSQTKQRCFLINTVLVLFHVTKSSRPKSFCLVERNIDVVGGLAREQ